MPLTCLKGLNTNGWWATIRLQPSRTASSTTASVTSRHNKTPETSASVKPTCRPALSYPSCKGRGANRSRVLMTSFIFTPCELKICFGKISTFFQNKRHLQTKNSIPTPQKSKNLLFFFSLSSVCTNLLHEYRRHLNKEKQKFALFLFFVFGLH